MICRVFEEFMKNEGGFKWTNLSIWILYDPSVKSLVGEFQSAEILLHLFSWLSAFVPWWWFPKSRSRDADPCLTVEVPFSGSLCLKETLCDGS